MNAIVQLSWLPAVASAMIKYNRLCGGVSGDEGLCCWLLLRRSEKRSCSNACALFTVYGVAVVVFFGARERPLNETCLVQFLRTNRSRRTKREEQFRTKIL